MKAKKLKSLLQVAAGRQRPAGPMVLGELDPQTGLGLPDLDTHLHGTFLTACDQACGSRRSGGHQPG